MQSQTTKIGGYTECPVESWVLRQCLNINVVSTMMTTQSTFSLSLTTLQLKRGRNSLNLVLSNCQQNVLVVPQLVVVPGSIQWFRAIDDRILKGSRDNVSFHNFQKHAFTVPLPFLPLDDSVKPLTKSDVRSQLKKCLAVFEDPNSVMVCEELRSVVCGTTLTP